MNAKKLKEIQIHLDRLYSELNAVTAMVRNETQQPDSSSSEQYDHLLPECLDWELSKTFRPR